MLFVFGQAQKGIRCRPTLCKTPEELFHTFGHPPESTHGLFFALKTLFLKRPCIIFKVEEEGFSMEDYMIGLKLLKTQWATKDIQAIGLPGVGDQNILFETEKICFTQKSLILITEQDLFDFLN